jgi:hypothetical protein
MVKAKIVDTKVGQWIVENQGRLTKGDYTGGKASFGIFSEAFTLRGASGHIAARANKRGWKVISSSGEQGTLRSGTLIHDGEMVAILDMILLRTTS